MSVSPVPADRAGRGAGTGAANLPRAGTGAAERDVTTPAQRSAT